MQTKCIQCIEQFCLVTIMYLQFDHMTLSGRMRGHSASCQPNHMDNVPKQDVTGHVCLCCDERRMTVFRLHLQSSGWFWARSKTHMIHVLALYTKLAAGYTSFLKRGRFSGYNEHLCVCVLVFASAVLLETRILIQL